MLARILSALVRVLAPVLSFTCEEVWDFMPNALRDEQSVHLADWPAPVLPADADALRAAYAVVLDVRDAVTRALETARNEKQIGKSQEAAVVVSVPAEKAEVLRARPAGALSELFIVASVEVLEAEGEIAVEVRAASGGKCPRCWNFREIGTDERHPDVCARCAGVLAGLGA